MLKQFFAEHWFSVLAGLVCATVGEHYSRGGDSPPPPVESVDIVLTTTARPMADGGQDIGTEFTVDLAIQSASAGPVPWAVMQAVLCWSGGIEIVEPKGEEIGPYQDWTAMRDRQTGERVEHFFDDRYRDGLNADMTDGELLYLALANFGEYPVATLEGQPIHRWTFRPTRAGNHRVWLKAESGKHTRTFVMSSTRAGVDIDRRPLVTVYTQSADPKHRR